MTFYIPPLQVTAMLSAVGTNVIVLCLGRVGGSLSGDAIGKWVQLAMVA